MQNKTTRKFKRPWPLLVASLVFFGSVIAGCDKDKAGEKQNVSASSTSWTQLFTGSPCGQYGTVGCTQQPSHPTCNSNWNSYTEVNENSITMTAGNDCRTINTHDTCQMKLGDNGVTMITFDFEVADSCHDSDGTEWLAFWIYSEPWNNQVEVDFIESKFGQGAGLNTNFAGMGKEIIIFDSSTNPWKGSITAKFSGSGDAVNVHVSNSVNSNVGTTTLTRDSGYFFVMDTATGSSASNCTITVSNLKVFAQTPPPAGQCAGLINVAD